MTTATQPAAEHSEVLYGRSFAQRDFPLFENRHLGVLASEGYIRELARLLGVKIEVKE